MKKNHIVNQVTGNCHCGISTINQLIAFEHDSDWFDSTVHSIDHSNYTSVLCLNCMKQHDVDLIDQFETDAFLIDYNNRLPNGKKAMRFFKCQARLKRQSIDQSKPTIKKAVVKVESKPLADQSIKSDKGKARAEKKKVDQSKKVNQSKASDDKCKIIAKPKKELIDKPIDDTVIELKDEIKKPLIDLSNGPVLIKTEEVIESIDPADDWSIGDPINDKDIFELTIGNDWKLIRHSKQLNQWKFVNRQTIKGMPKWIDDSEFINYNEAAELINAGYCE